MSQPDSRRGLLWIVATALFMEQLDSTIVNTAVPAIAASLQVAPLALKGVVASYLLSLAVFIPVSGWMADRFGTRRVFGAAVALFTLASLLCALSVNVPMLVAARVLQGLGAAMMVPVGRLLVVRSFARSELLVAMNFVIVPALLGPLLGPTVGGVLVHGLSWRAIFFVNLPVGLAALWFMQRHLPDYRHAVRRPLDVLGLLLFGTGTTLLSWFIGVFGEHSFDASSFAILLLAIGLLTAYGVHARRAPHPLMSFALFRVRTFRVAVLGGFVTRLGLGSVPLLLPLLYQLGFGWPAWQSGLLLVPMAASAMWMKVVAPRLLASQGFRRVLIANTVMIGATIALFSQVTASTPLLLLVLLGAAQGAFNSLQFSSMNSMAYADVDAARVSAASSIASTLQQLSMSFGMALGTLVTAWFLGDRSQADQAAVTGAIHAAFLTLGALTMLSAWSFSTLRTDDGQAVSRGALSKT
jgi:EmrB/QacA subfamily drug resistance transporter